VAYRCYGKPKLEGKMKFEEFRKEIKSCKICTFKNRHNDPFYFKCKSPEKVKCLIITEQPKEDKNNSVNDEPSKNDLELNRNSTTGKLIEIFGETFKNSIINESSVYYWTHHTKCPSRKREPRNRCINEWFKKELKLFPNLSSIITFGAKPYSKIVSISNNLNDNTFYDYFWKEIEMIVQKKFSKDDLKITIDCEDYTFLALPHPSGVSPLSHLLIKFERIITWIKNEL